MLKRILIILAVLMLFVVALPATAIECGDPLGCVVIEEDDPITIAYMLTTSGATAFLGEDSVGGIELAILEREGESMGHEIELVGEDSLCSPEGGQTAAQRIAADETVLGVIGTSCSSAATGALPILSEAGLLMLSPTNTSTTLTNDDPDAGGIWQAGYYRTAHNDLFQGEVAAIFAYEVLGARTLATIHDGSAYADSLQVVMARVFEELGGEVTFQGAINVGDTNMAPILTEIASNVPDILYLPVFEPESNFVVAQVQEVPGLEDTVLMGADASLVDGFAANTGDASVGVYLSGPFVSSNDTYDAFLEVWDEEIGGVPPAGFHAHAYDAANILLNAIEAVAEEGDDGSIIIGRQALRDAVGSTEGHEGLTGVLSCQSESPFRGDCATGEALAIFEITDAELEGNWPPPVAFTLDMLDD